MKLAREPASSRPKPCTSQKSAPRTHARSLLFVGSRRKKTDRSQTSYFLFETNSPVRAFDSRAQGLSTPLARRRSSYPPPTPNLVFIHPTEGTSVHRYACACAAEPYHLPGFSRQMSPIASIVPPPPQGRQNGVQNRLTGWTLSSNQTGAASQPTR